MSDSNLLYEIEEGVATITFNRPDVLNALTKDVLGQLIARLEDATDDPAVRVVVLTGSGRGFCSGADVRAMAARKESGNDENVAGGDEKAADELRSLERASELLHNIPKPTVAAVNGACAGAGLSLACAADLRFAAESASFTSAFLRVGSSGDFGGIWFASRIVGPAKARELFFLSEKVSSASAKTIGLVSAVFPDEQFREAVSELTGRLARFAPLTLTGMKTNFILAARSELGDYLTAEARTCIRVRRTKDSREAARAFIERRDPVFSGS